MKRFAASLCFFFILSLSVMSQESADLAGGLDIGKMIGQMKLDKGAMARMIDQLVQTGQITAEDARKAKEQLLKMDECELNKLKLDAVELYKKNEGDPSKILDPAMAKKLEELKSNMGESELTKKLRELEQDDN